MIAYTFGWGDVIAAVAVGWIACAIFQHFARGATHTQGDRT